ncbi:hypothetical protein GFS60_06480 (plasmid) [Rhodococcus sp. WAY2]|nr:hypothetical protein GFS60_06480 [Rhodococcus sp. WAY2]
MNWAFWVGRMSGLDAATSTVLSVPSGMASDQLAVWAAALV